MNLSMIGPRIKAFKDGDDDAVAGYALIPSNNALLLYIILIKKKSRSYLFRLKSYFLITNPVGLMLLEHDLLKNLFGWFLLIGGMVSIF